MGLKKAENQVRILLADTILALCRNTLPFHAEISVEGLLGITLDSEEIFLVNISQTIKNEVTPKSSGRKRSLHSSSKKDRRRSRSDSDDSSSDSSDSDQDTHRLKRRRRRSKKKKKIKEEKITSDENSMNLSGVVCIPDEEEASTPCTPTKVFSESDRTEDRPCSVGSHDDQNSRNALLIKPETMEELTEMDEEGVEEVAVKDEIVVSPPNDDNGYADTLDEESYQNEEIVTDPLQSQVPFQENVVSAEGLENCIPTTSADSPVSAFPPQSNILGRMSEQAVALGNSLDVSQLSAAQLNTAQLNTAQLNTAQSDDVPLSANQLAEEARRQGSKACVVCGKQFHMHCDLVRHLRIHTNERPHPCPACHKWFRTTGNLRSHLRTHLSRGEIRL